MQCILSLTKIARFWPAKFVFIPACDWIQLPYLVCRHALEFSTWLDSLGCRLCRIASKTLTWNKLFKRQKKKGDQTNLNKEDVFRCWNVFCSLRRTVKCNGVVLVWFVQKIQGRDWRLPKWLNTSLHVVKNSSNSYRLQIAILVSHTHMELRHAVTTHQWTRKPVY